MKSNTFFLAALLACLMAVPLPSFAGAAAESSTQLKPIVRHAIKSDVSPPLRSITPLASRAGELREIPLHHLPKAHSSTATGAQSLAVDPALQQALPSGNMPGPIQNFDGVKNADNPFPGALPPDTEGDVGPNHYVQWVNISFAIYDKTGMLLYGPAAGHTLWTGFGGPCETSDDGDPIVQYDHLADRWLMSQFALPNFPSGPFYQCIAVSQTPDPTGAFYRYAFLISATKLNDYPKFGVWPDAYYMSINEFICSFFECSFVGEGAVAFERDKMLAGDPDARIVLFELAPPFGGVLPSDLDGLPPPDGSPNFFVEVDAPPDFPTHRLNLFQFHVDWTDPSNSALTGPTILETDPFNPDVCSDIFSRCVPQPGTSAKLDALSDRLMYRLQYRNFGNHESLVSNHTVNVGGDQAGIRWYELRKSGADDWAIYQQGTYAPDTDHRWMGSLAMDKAGNMALGFSISSSTTFPSIRYVGRLADDPLGTMPRAEATLIDGGGSQLHPSGRWGDYSFMAIDPTDDCTLWYTQEYYAMTSNAGWQTRIGAFQFPGCGAAPGAPPLAPSTGSSK